MSRIVVLRAEQIAQGAKATQAEARELAQIALQSLRDLEEIRDMQMKTHQLATKLRHKLLEMI